MAITTKQQRQQRRSEALQLIADGVPPTDAATQLTVKWGLKAAVADAGGDDVLAIRLMEAHSPSEQCDWDVEQVCLSGGDHIGPGTLFHYAKQYGWSRHAKP